MAVGGYGLESAPGYPPYRYVKIYGERNTATNYLEALVRLNLDIRILPGVVPPAIVALERALPGREWLRDLYFRFFGARTLGWKHARIDSIGRLAKHAKNLGGVVFISVTKNPYSWLMSLHRHPYHQYYKDKPDFERFLVTPWRTVIRDCCPQAFVDTPVDLWNIKNRSYIELGAIGGVNLTAESLLDNPMTVMQRLIDDYGIAPKVGFFTNQEACVKGGGGNYYAFRDYYLQGGWRLGLSRAAIEIINSRLDKDLMRYYGYGWE